VIACGDGSVDVFDAATDQLLTQLPAFFGVTVDSAFFSPDGKSIITAEGGHSAGGVQIWSTELANPSLPAVEQIARQFVHP
jgi:hypothetical protein